MKNRGQKILKQGDGNSVISRWEGENCVRFRERGPLLAWEGGKEVEKGEALALEGSDKAAGSFP